MLQQNNIFKLGNLLWLFQWTLVFFQLNLSPWVYWFPFPCLSMFPFSFRNFPPWNLQQKWNSSCCFLGATGLGTELGLKAHVPGSQNWDFCLSQELCLLTTVSSWVNTRVRAWGIFAFSLSTNLRTILHRKVVVSSLFNLSCYWAILPQLGQLWPLDFDMLPRLNFGIQSGLGFELTL